MGLDVLNGKWKKTVGLVNKPSVYASATVARNVNKACSNGVEIRLGVKNQLYIAALDKYNLPLRTDIIYERGLACIRYIQTPTDRNKLRLDIRLT